MVSALRDVKVIEYGDYISAPFCSKLMGDLGAEVIKIEKPTQGDSARRHGPFLHDDPHLECSGLFQYLNSNKLGITLDIEKPTGKQIFMKLIKSSDVLIEDNHPGTMEAVGLSYNQLKSINTSFVMTSITPFGQTGPYKEYRGSDLVSWHMGGAGYVTPRHAGKPEQPPLRVMQVASFLAGITGAVATMCALRIQRRTGIGQFIDISQLEAVVLFSVEAIAYWSYEHRNDTRVSRSHYAPLEFVRCKDGWALIHAVEEHHWKRFVDLMGNPEWAQEESFDTAQSRADYWESLEPLIAEWTKIHTKREIFELGKAKKIPLAPANTIADVVAGEQMKERKFFIETDHPLAGRLTYPGAPYKFSMTPWELHTPAPLLGQHNEEIYCDRLGYTKNELIKMYETGII